MPGETVHIPEVIEPDDKLPRDLVALRKFSVLLDEAVVIPGTKFRFGLDPVLGLIPGIGDVISAMLSAWIVAGALRHRVPLRKIARMVFNILVDLVVGEIPILGDIFDFAFEENVMNMRILMQYRNRRLPPRSMMQIAFVFAIVIAIIAIIGILSIAAVIAALIWIAAQRTA